MDLKAGLTGMYCNEGKEEIDPGKVPGKLCLSASSISLSEIPDCGKDVICGCETEEILEIQPSDEISMMKDMLVLAGIEGRDATSLKFHFDSASKNLKSGNSRGFETEAELFYMEFDRIYADETESIFH